VDARTIIRLGPFLVVAALATGCTPLRARSNYVAPAPDPTPPGPAQTNPIAGGTVVSAGSAGAVQPAGGGPVPPGAGEPPLAQPRPLPAPPTWPPQPQQSQQPLPAKTGDQPPLMMAPGVPPGTISKPDGKADPHVRTSPTATGARLNLAPYEVPTDRVVELSVQLELALAQNRELLAKIKELEGAGYGREEALHEAARELEYVTADALRTRSTLQAQIVGLQSKMRQLEEEDIIFLKAVIEALSRLLPPEKK
jgi:hypothetical protein